MASVSNQPESNAAETSQEPEKTILLEDPEKENFPVSSSSSSSEVKTLESSNDPHSDKSPGEISSTPSAAVTTEIVQGQLTYLPALKEFVKIVPNQETLPIFTPSVSYGGMEDEQTIRAASVNSEGNPLIKNEQIVHGHQFLGSDSPTNLDFRSQNSDDNSSTVQQLTCMQYYVVYSIYLANSLLIVPFFVALMGMCCVALFMGSAYYDKCELMKITPLFVVFLGALGIMGLWTRISTLVSRKGWLGGHGDCRYATITIIVAFLIVYLSEVCEYVYYMNDFTTEQGPSYCDPFFHNYVKYNNLATFLVIIILIAIHWPNSLSFAK